ncbi:MAG: hypothetical protein GY789_09515 [Hyphomicrobiales bacterium]|nr:hypothetical protein [Hyphomicrobiales bacterium]MCP4998653.1 hypothetical protein [Hyphomicrobiales bacterium]
MNVEINKHRRILSEEADDYPHVVFQQGATFRLITCRDGIQWIPQTRGTQAVASTRWKPRSYHRSKKSLIRRLHTLLPEVDPKNQAILDALPSWIEEGGACDDHC